MRKVIRPSADNPDDTSSMDSSCYRIDATDKLFASVFREEGQLMIKRNRREISVRPLSQSKIELLKAEVSAICQFRRCRHAFSKSTYVQNAARLGGSAVTFT